MSSACRATGECNSCSSSSVETLGPLQQNNLSGDIADIFPSAIQNDNQRDDVSSGSSSDAGETDGLSANRPKPLKRMRPMARLLDRITLPARISRLFSYSKNKWDFAKWTGIVTGSSCVIISLLFIFVFVLQPKSSYDLASHNFISDGSILYDGEPRDGLNRWLEDFSRSIIPIMCHSHNDYWRPYPLFSALAAGCSGVEADVWLNDDGTDLLVGHDAKSLVPSRSFKSMYVDPLVKLLDHENPPEVWENNTVYDRPIGVFPTQPNTTLALLVDVKTDPDQTWALVLKQLEPLREKRFLTRYENVYPKPGFIERQHIWPSAVTVVGSGSLNISSYHRQNGVKRSFHEYHDTFLDAPLAELPTTNHFHWYDDGSTSSSTRYYPENSYYASVSFNQAIGSVRFGFSDKQLANLRKHIRIARLSGLKTRYWDLPSWPINYRDYVWDVLTREGVGMLSIDDLESASRRGWNQGYIRSVLWMSLVSVYVLLCSIGLLVIGIWIMKRKKLILNNRQPIYLP